MISHLADSDRVVDFLLARRDAVAALSPHLRDSRLAISIVVYGEIYEGLAGNLEDRAVFRRWEDFLAGVDVLGLDTETAKEYGRRRADLRRRGLLIADNDLWIAATALRHDLTLLSRDAHFERIPGLRIERT